MCLPVGQGLNLGPLLFIDGLVALNEGQVGLWCDVGGASVSRLKFSNSRLISCHIEKQENNLHYVLSLTINSPLVEPLCYKITAISSRCSGKGTKNEQELSQVCVLIYCLLSTISPLIKS